MINVDYCDETGDDNMTRMPINGEKFVLSNRCGFGTDGCFSFFVMDLSTHQFLSESTLIFPAK